MAIWQFSLYLIPNESIKRMFKDTPSKLSLDVAEDTSWWSGYQPHRGFENTIHTILPEMHSWSESLRIWGDESANAILVGYLTGEKREVEEIEIRIDVSNLSNEFVLRACRWAADLDCLGRTKAHEVVRPEYFEVHETIMRSRAMRFVQDPVKTLQSLRKDEFDRKG